MSWATWRADGAEWAVDYPVHVTEGEAGSPDAASAPQYRYTAELAGDIERAWQETWARLGTFNVPNPVGDLAPSDGAGVP